MALPACFIKTCANIKTLISCCLCFILILVCIQINTEIDYQNLLSKLYTGKQAQTSLRNIRNISKLETRNSNLVSEVDRVETSGSPPRFAILVNAEQCLPDHLKSKEYFADPLSCDCHVFVLR